MNTVTIGLEEYLELRKLRDGVIGNSYTVRYWMYNEMFSFEICTNDAQVIGLIKKNDDLANAIVAQSKLIQPPKKKWWKL